MLRHISTIEQIIINHSPETLCCTVCIASFSHFYSFYSPKRGLKVIRLALLPFTPHSQFTWKAVESIFVLQNASLFGRLQFTFGFPNQLDHPDHLWQVPGQRPLLAPPPAAQGGGQHTFWGCPPSAPVCFTVDV